MPIAFVEVFAVQFPGPPSPEPGVHFVSDGIGPGGPVLPPYRPWGRPLLGIFKLGDCAFEPKRLNSLRNGRFFPFWTISETSFGSELRGLAVRDAKSYILPT